MPSFTSLLASGIIFALPILAFIRWRFGGPDTLAFIVVSGAFTAIMGFHFFFCCAELCLSGSIAALGIHLHRYFAAGTAVAAPARGGSATILAPTSCSSRWKSGDAMMIFPAAARRRSTSSPDREKDVVSSFR